ncbi:PEP-CTERM sorting domain-containing protein [Akkermansia glycaniphila]|uniref:Pep exosort: pep-cterm protein-sorting domain n=1 Tax=Akkermansia glycaniphila TaxID=1679444 RepID=A0A1C7PCT2_9BACT|nr:PEP-CTERM sorting domain-containing protein [Akkermansia glycaniphila]MBT9448576.1 PEP-CTERM sorting domain-containing protein [Akkermansia glycaniphila]OCA03345.1 hypothetical protein AC781_05655 [Akkermansia glycaniphila]SEH80239.1 pep exosort: pep-cterm protein-sorting domain [Akkermansia glycaniphila]
MKKTWITLAALSLFSVASAATDPYTEYLTTNPTLKQDGISNKATGNGNYYGFTFSFQNTPNAVTTSNGTTVTTLPSTLKLDSLSLYTRSSGSSSYTSAFKIALCVFASDGSAGQLISISSNAQVSTGASAEMKFNFASGVTLNTSDRIQVLFVNENTTAANWDWNTARLNQPVGISLLLSENNLPSGCGTYKNNTLNSWEGLYIPSMTVRTHTGAIPEPATAALSLLGLAGLMMRRRRA